MRKKRISVLITLFMVFCLFPMTASATTNLRNVYVGGTKVNTGSITYWISDKNGGITSSGADATNYVVKYEKLSGNVPELTLRGVNLTAVYSYGDGNYGIYADGDLNIYLAEEKSNNVTGAANSGMNSYGIYVGGSFGIFGSGSLTASGGNANTSCGMYTTAGVLISGSLNISTIGGTANESYGIQATNYVMLTGGTVTAKSTSPSGTAQAIKVPSIIGDPTITASRNASGSSPETYLSQNLNLYKYMNLYVYIDPNTEVVNYAKKMIEAGSYSLMQDAANTEIAVKTALATQINALPGMNTTGITVTASNIIVSSFKAATTGTSAKPEGTNGSFTFTVSLTKGEITQATTDKSGTITATAFSDTMAVAAAKTAIVNGIVTVDSDADQTAKTAAVQNYVNSKLTGDAAGVNATVTHSSDNTYQVALNKGAVNDNTTITMTINIDSKVAEIEGTKYKTLQEAVDAVQSGKEIKMLTDTILTTAVTVSSTTSKSFVLDLNGKTIDGGDNSAIIKTCMGTLTITDRSDGAKGKITSKKIGREDSCGTIYMDYGKLVLEKGTVENSYVDTNPNYSYAIYNFRSSDVTILGGEVLTTGNGTSTICNYSGGTMTISGGTVSATGNKSSAIQYYRWGTLNITGGVISCSGSQSQTISVSDSQNVSIQGGTITNTNSSGVTISSESQGTISISGGTVSAPGGGTAIRVDNKGKVNISGKDTRISSNGSFGTIRIYGESVDVTALEIKGGTIENTQGLYTIENKGSGKVSVSGDSIIKGAKQAMTTAPELSDSIEVTASMNYDGSSPVNEYMPEQIKNYKNLIFEYNPDISPVKKAQKIIVDSTTYTVAQDVATTEADLRTALAAQINALSNMKATGVMVKTSDITLTKFQKAVAGTPSDKEGTDGSFTFNVSIEKGTAKRTVTGKTGSITATAYTDTVAVAEAKTIIEKGSYTVTQSAATPETALIAELVTQINALYGMSDTEVTVEASGIEIITYNDAVAGSSTDKTGTNGSFTFRITLKKGIAEKITTDLAGTITATAFNDTIAVAEAKTIIEGGSYTVTQSTATSGTAVIAELVAQINALPGMSTTEVTVEASDIEITTFNSAVTGSSTNKTGTNGSFTFSVSLEKGKAKQTLTGKTGTITATAFNDTIAVAEAKSIIEAGSYTIAQASVSTGGAITTAIAVKINTLTGMSSTAVEVTGSSITVTAYEAAQEGTPGNPSGTNGIFTFRVALTKGVVTTTAGSITGTITATPYTGLSDVAAVDAAKTAVIGGTVTVDFGAQQTTKTAAVQNYVDSLLTGDAAGVTAVVTCNSDNTYLVSLRKGDTTDSKTITMTINENANPDTALVEEAKTLVAGGSYTLSQAAANTETAVKEALAAQINALPGMSSKGVIVTASDITITQFTAAVAGTSGNSSGTNGSVTFSVSLTKGLAATIMTGKTGTINATTYVAPDGGNNPPATRGGGGAGAPVKKEGKIEKDQKQEGNAPTANLMNSTEDLKAIVLSAADQEQMAAGKDARVILKVQDISASVSAEDKKQIEEKMAAEHQNTANPALLFIDISLFKQVGDGEETRITETNGKIKISIAVPESMWNTENGTERTYRVVRIHNGITEILEGTYDPTTHLFTFETDRFSTYALTYQDLNMISVDTEQSQSGPIAIVQDFYHLRLTAKADQSSQKLTYAKVTSADGYFIYGAQYGKKLKKLADVKGIVRNYTVKKLKKATYYTYQVKAYKIMGGKKVIVAESRMIYSVTANKTYGNPIKIMMKNSSITMEVGKTKKVTYQIVLPENKKRKEFASSTCFETTNQEIATITDSGKITAIAKGTCDIYVYAQNGVYKKIKVTVK